MAEAGEGSRTGLSSPQVRREGQEQVSCPLPWELEPLPVSQLDADISLSISHR